MPGRVEKCVDLLFLDSVVIVRIQPGEELVALPAVKRVYLGVVPIAPILWLGGLLLHVALDSRPFLHIPEPVFSGPRLDQLHPHTRCTADEGREREAAGDAHAWCQGRYEVQ